MESKPTCREASVVGPEETTEKDSTFDRRRRIIGAICGPLCALLVWITPIEGLTPEAHKLLAIMTLVALWWTQSWANPCASPFQRLRGVSFLPFERSLPFPDGARVWRPERTQVW